MSDQTATNQPSKVVLCKMGCGFFGSSATGDCCSKCWLATQKKKEGESSVSEKCQASQSMDVEVKEKKEDAMEVDEIKPVVEKKPVAETPKKKKKKKTSYKNMMAGMMKSNSPPRDIQKEKEALRNVTGGGAFSKIDKI